MSMPGRRAYEQGGREFASEITSKMNNRKIISSVIAVTLVAAIVIASVLTVNSKSSTTDTSVVEEFRCDLVKDLNPLTPAKLG